MIKPNADSFNLEPDLPILLFANLAVWADLIRHQAHVASAEYAIETEFRVVGGPVHVKGPNDYLVWETLQPGLRIFPRYSLGDSTEIPQLLNLFCRDFWNFLGKSVEETSTLVIENWSGQEFEDQ